MDPLEEEYPWNSTYAFAEGGPIENIDLDGLEKVHYIFNIPDGRMSGPAKTREEEIKEKHPQDIVHRIEYTDLGLIKSKIAPLVEKYKKLGYKTSEVAFFSHAGADGPMGTEDSSEGALSVADGNQLKLGYWQTIDFDFDSKGSIFSVFGCKSADFTTKILSVQPNLTHAAGQGGQTGDSYDYGSFNTVIFNIWGQKTYQRDEFGINVSDRTTESTLVNTPQGLIPYSFPKFEVIQGNPYVLEGKFLVNDSKSGATNESMKMDKPSLKPEPTRKDNTTRPSTR